jgi:hypothetical protein
MRLEGVEDVGRAEQEETRVPEVPPIGQEGAAVTRSGFSRKLASRTAAPGRRRRRELEIAVARLGPVGGHAEGHERAVARRLRPRSTAARKAGRVGDHVVRGRHEHQRIGILGARRSAAVRTAAAVSRPSGSTMTRLGEPHGGGLFGGEEAEGVARDERRPKRDRQSGAASPGRGSRPPAAARTAVGARRPECRAAEG